MDLVGARVSFEKLVQEPLHVSQNVEFSPLSFPPRVRTPELCSKLAPLVAYEISAHLVAPFGPCSEYASQRTSLFGRSRGIPSMS